MKKILFSLLCSLFLFTACSDDDERNETAPYLRIPETVKALHYLKDVQRENIKIETNSEDWTVTSDQLWCDVHRISSNPQMFRLELDENVELEQRDAILTLKGGGITETITVKQLGSEPAILINPEKLDNLPGTKGDYDLVITTNVSSFEWNILQEDKSWLEIKEAPQEDKTRAMVDSKYILTVQSNFNLQKRSSTIVFVGNGDEEVHPSVELSIVQRQRSTDVDDVEMGEDTKITPQNAWASTEQTSAQPISNSYDGYKDNDHCYHRSYQDNGEFPVILEYYFDGTQEMDYVMYYANSNGKFKEVDLYYLDAGDAISFDQSKRPETSPSKDRTWTKINKSYTLSDTQGGQRISFPERLTNVLGVKLEVKSSYDGKLVACNEMEFYKINASPLDAQLLGVFTDLTCCELRDNISDEDINNLPGYFAQLAFQIKNGTYSDWEKKFRIQDYKPYSNVFETADKMLIKKYGNQDNITGISVEEGDEIFVLVGNTYGNEISLQVLGEETVNSDDAAYVQTEDPSSAQNIQLMEGVNKVKIDKTGMLFVLYSADPTNAQNQPIRIHIPYKSGKVSGFFDLATDKTDAVYTELLNRAEYKYFGVRGEEIIFYFHTSQLKKVAPNNIVAAIELWDDIVGWEHEIMGFTGDFRKRYNNHVFAISPEGGYMWQSEYRVAFVYTYLENILLPDNVLKVEDNAWGPAHEIGHIHQKVINWPGCSESSNNLFSNYVIYKMGKYHSRGYGLCRAVKARFVENDPWAIFGEKGTPKNEDTEIHMRMYWQLFVYYHLCKGNKDFWPTVFANMRNSYPGGYTEKDPGSSQMKFVKAVCAAANEDLTDFFDFWGFFTPYSGVINQYGDFNYNVTKQMISDTKEAISKYEKKAAPIQYIEDRKKSWFKPDTNEYRDKESGDVGFYDQYKGTAEQFADDEVTANVSGKDVTVDSAIGIKAVGFEVRNGLNRDGVLMFFSNDYNFTLPDNIKTNEVSFWAVQADGARKSIKMQ